MAKLIQQDLQKVNINLNIITTNNFDAILNKKKIMNLGMVLDGWIGDNADPDNFFRPNLSCEAMKTGFNLSNWCNKDFETLLDKGIQTNVLHQRKTFYTDLQQLIRETLPIVPLIHGTYYQIINNKLKGYQTTPFGDMSFAGVIRSQ